LTKKRRMGHLCAASSPVCEGGVILRGDGGPGGPPPFLRRQGKTSTR
jgi:hypothetical protein